MIFIIIIFFLDTIYIYIGEIAFGVPFSSIKNGLAAFETIPAAGTAQLFAFIGLLELGFGARQEEIEEAQLKASGE